MPAYRVQECQRIQGTGVSKDTGYRSVKGYRIHECHWGPSERTAMRVREILIGGGMGRL
jgi:hypothetical protein